MRTLTMLLLCVVGVCRSAQPSHGQDQPGGASQRLAYSVKHGSAKSLAPVLAKHFKGAADIQAAADAPENVVLISAPPVVLKEVVTLLQHLDRKPRQIAVDVWVGVVRADAAPKAPDAAAPQPKEPDQQLDLREFTGPVAKVLPKLAALKARGRAGQWKHFQGSTLENQALTVNETELTPSVTGMVVRPNGMAVKSWDRRSTGLSGKMTLMVTPPHNSVLADLQLSYSRAQDGKLLGIENGMPVHETDLAMASFKFKALIPSGQAVALQAVTESRAAGTGQTLLVISARVVDPGDRKAK